MENDDLPIKSAGKPNPEIEARKTKIIQDKAKRIREQEQRKRQKEQEKRQKALGAEAARNTRQDRQAADKQRSIDRSASADQKKQERRAGVTTRDAMRKNKSKTTAGKSFFGNRSSSNLAVNSSTEINCTDDMVGLNEDMYFKVKIEGLPTMYVNSANREELRKDLVGLLRNPSKAVGNIKRVTPAEVKKRLRLRSQGKEEEEEMDESYIKFDHPKLEKISKGFPGRKEAERHNDHLVGKKKASGKSYVLKHKDNKFYVVDIKESVEMNESDGYYMMTQAKKSAASAGEDYNDRSVADRHTAKVAKKMGYTHKDYASGTYYKSRMPGSRIIESSVTRSRISGEMDKASGRTQIDRENDLAKAKAARKQSTKDLEKFRADNAELLKGSSVDEAKAPNKSKSYIQQLRRQHAELKRQHQQLVRNELGLAEDVMTSTSADSQVKLNPETGKYEKQRMKRGQINAQTATKGVMSKLKDHYTNESSAYYAGLSKSTADNRKAHFKKHGKKADDDNSAYKPAPGDATAKTKPSIHTKKAAAMGMGPTDEACWDSHKQVGMKKKGKKMVPNCVPKNESYNINENKKGLENKAEKSGMPLGVLKQVYNRGLAAWKTGHRPGTTPEQWGMARVNSFITKSSGTWGKADKDLAAKVKK